MFYQVFQFPKSSILHVLMQGRRKLDNWGGGGGADIHIYVFTHHKNNRFEKKLIVQNTNI